MHPESHSWPHLGRARQEALPPGWRRNGRAIPVLPTSPLTPLPPLSPCRALPYSRRSTLEKIDCLFLPDCSRVTGCRDGGRGGPGAGGLLLIRMDFSASLLVGRAGTGYGRLLKE